MKNNEFIKRYGKENLKSLIEGVKENLMVLHYNKEIPKYKINTKKKQVEFCSNGKFISFDIAEIFYMNNTEIIKAIKVAERGIKNATRQL